MIIDGTQETKIVAFQSNRCKVCVFRFAPDHYLRRECIPFICKPQGRTTEASIHRWRVPNSFRRQEYSMR
jgi:hypothetical protein